MYRNNKNLNVQEVKFVCSLAGYGSSLIVNEEVIAWSCVDWQCNESVYWFVQLAHPISISIFNCINYFPRHSDCAQRRTNFFFLFLKPLANFSLL